MLISLLRAAPRIQYLVLGYPFFFHFQGITPFSSGLGGWEGKGGGRANSQNLTAVVWVVAASLAKMGWPFMHSHARHPKAGSHR